MASLRETYLDSITKAQEAANAYYNGTGESDFTDEQYDLFVSSIADLGEQNNWTEHLALTEQVAAGQAQIPDNEKVEHKQQMLSLRKAQNAQELENFITKLGFPDSDYVAEPKFDGLAISAVYEDGKLTLVATRGNSRVGQNVTRQAKNATINGLPSTIPVNGSLEVRGELLITKSAFTAAQKKRVAATGKEYANARGAVSGAIQSKSGTDLQYMELTFVAYDSIANTADSNFNSLDSYRARAQYLETLGFTPALSLLPAEVKLATTTHEAVEAFEPVRDKFNYPTDGIVIKLDSLRVRSTLGVGSRHPHWAIAYKYEAEVVTTRLKRIIRDVGRTGAISYRGDLVPVEVAESKVSKATLNNSRFIADLDLRYGDTVYLRKANEIIPEIISVVLTERNPDAKKYVAPTYCPSCKAPLDTTSSIIWRCPNAKNCPAQRIARMVYAASRNLLDIQGLSTSVVTAAAEQYGVKDVTDLYKLTVEQYANLKFTSVDEDGTPKTILYGQKRAQKTVEQLEKSKNQPLSRILSSLGLRFLGNTFGSRFAKHFKTFDAVITASVPQLQQVEGVKDKATVIHKEILDNSELISKYRKVGFVNLNAVASTSAASSKLKGQSVVITGAVPGYSRNEAKELIESHGGNAAGSVSKTTTLLVAPAEERETSKAKKAASLGIKIITPDEFLKQLS